VSPPGRVRVVIGGGGVAAVEAALALRELAPGRLDLMLVAPNAEFALPPDTVAEAVGGPAAARFELRAIADDVDAVLVPDAIVSVDADAKRVMTRDGRALAYDALVLAVGARPGRVLPGAQRFAGGPDVAALRSALGALDGLPCPRIVFAATGGTAWTLPLYELALLTAARLDDDGRDRLLTLLTPEAEPIGVFGHAASREIGRLLTSRQIELRPGAIAERFEDKRLWLATGGSMPADLVVALPEPVGPGLRGLPADEGGFVPVDRFGRVPGVPAVWAVGDATARPLKQGGLAAQQADVAARSIAAWAGADVEPEPYEPVLRGLLLTGGEPRFLRREAGSAVPSTASDRPLWSPAGKLAGRHIGPYLALRS
jgi:sulfide:quinone oxidoreductase